MMMMKYGTSLNFPFHIHPSTYIIIIVIIIFHSLLKLYATFDFNVFPFEPVQEERNFSSLKLNYVTIYVDIRQEGKKQYNMKCMVVRINVSFFSVLKYVMEN